jgi:hypothetical protein
VKDEMRAKKSLDFLILSANSLPVIYSRQTLERRYLPDAKSGLAYKLLKVRDMDPRNTDLRNISGAEKRPRRPQKNGLRRGAKGRPRQADPTPEQRRPGSGTLGRTRTLVTAALRVWELKQGFH